MNILILNWRDIKNPQSGGAELVTMEHARYWANKGNDVTWFTSSFLRSKHQENIQGVKIIRKGDSITVFFHAFLYYIRNKKKFDIVIDEIHGIPFFTPLYVRSPRLIFIHEIAKEIWNYMYPFPVSTLGRFIEPFCLKLYKNEKFWVPAKSLFNELIGFGVQKQNISIIYCGNFISPLKNIFKKKEKKPTFIFISRLVKMKGVEEIIESFKLVNDKLIDGQLWIVGGGEKKYIEKLKKIVIKYNLSKSVTFFGYVSEQKKIELLKKSHILLHASIKEGWGLVVIEAASQSTPAIVYNVAGLRDSVKHNKTGIVLSKNSPQIMAEEIIKLLEDKKKYQFFQKNCLKWAKSLKWKNSTSQSLRLLKKLVYEKKN